MTMAFFEIFFSLLCSFDFIFDVYIFKGSIVDLQCILVSVVQ